MHSGCVGAFAGRSQSFSQSISRFSYLFSMKHAEIKIIYSLTVIGLSMVIAVPAMTLSSLNSDCTNQLQVLVHGK